MKERSRARRLPPSSARADTSFEEELVISDALLASLSSFEDNPRTTSQSKKAKAGKVRTRGGVHSRTRAHGAWESRAGAVDSPSSTSATLGGAMDLRGRRGTFFGTYKKSVRINSAVCCFVYCCTLTFSA